MSTALSVAAAALRLARGLPALAGVALTQADFALAITAAAGKSYHKNYIRKINKLWKDENSRVRMYVIDQFEKKKVVTNLIVNNNDNNGKLINDRENIVEELNDENELNSQSSHGNFSNTYIEEKKVENDQVENIDDYVAKKCNEKNENVFEEECSWSTDLKNPRKNIAERNENLCQYLKSCDSNDIPLHTNIEEIENEFYRIIDNRGAGNCLFYVMSLFLYGTDEFFNDIRILIVNEAIKNWENVKKKHAWSWNIKKFMDPSKYESLMSQNKYYGTDFEIFIFNKIYKVPIHIYFKYSDGSISTLGRYEAEGNSEPLKILMITAENNENILSDVDYENHKNYENDFEGIGISTYYSNQDNVSITVDDPEKHSIIDDSSYTEETNLSDKKHEVMASTQLSITKNSLRNRQISDKKVYDFKSEEEDEDESIDDTNISSNGSDNEKPAKKISEKKLVLYHYMIEDAMIEQFGSTCVMGFYSGPRFNKNDIVFYAKCRQQGHQMAHFKCRFDHLDRQSYHLVIHSNCPIKKVHDFDRASRVYKTVKGEPRKVMKEQLEHTSVTKYMDKLVMNTVHRNDVVNDGYPLSLHTTNVAYTAKSEMKCAERLRLDSPNLQDIIQLCIEERTQQFPFLHKVGIPLTAIMYHELAIRFFKEKRGIVMHYDATGSIIRKPQQLDEKMIFGYFLVSRIAGEILLIGAIITSDHSMYFQTSLLSAVKNFFVIILSFFMNLCCIC
ncbi:hypothetical protein TKK_0010925 [Trichogramma kaykai]